MAANRYHVTPITPGRPRRRGQQGRAQNPTALAERPATTPSRSSRRRFWLILLLASRRVIGIRKAELLTGGPAWYRVGRFLGPSISTHYRRYSLDDHIAAWHAAGLTDVGTGLMSLGGGLIMWGRKAAGPGS